SCFGSTSHRVVRVQPRGARARVCVPGLRLFRTIGHLRNMRGWGPGEIVRIGLAGTEGHVSRRLAGVATRSAEASARTNHRPARPVLEEHTDSLRPVPLDSSRLSVAGNRRISPIRGPLPRPLEAAWSWFSRPRSLRY